MARNPCLSKEPLRERTSLVVVPIVVLFVVSVVVFLVACGPVRPDLAVGRGKLVRRRARIRGRIERAGRRQPHQHPVGDPRRRGRGPVHDHQPVEPGIPRIPTIEAIASQGVNFTNCWAMPECSPSRVSFFTGRYPSRTGVGSPLTQTTLAQSQCSPFEVTAPRLLEEAGYRSAALRQVPPRAERGEPLRHLGAGLGGLHPLQRHAARRTALHRRDGGRADHRSRGRGLVRVPGARQSAGDLRMRLPGWRLQRRHRCRRLPRRRRRAADFGRWLADHHMRRGCDRADRLDPLERQLRVASHRERGWCRVPGAPDTRVRRHRPGRTRDGVHPEAPELRHAVDVLAVVHGRP